MPTTVANLPDEDLVLVYYARNAETFSGTAAMKFLDDDRPDLNIGTAGYVTKQELLLATAHGIQLEPTNEAELQKLGVVVPEKLERQPELEDLTVEELRDLADEEHVELGDRRKKGDIVAAIRDSRTGVATGADSLPATAAVNPNPSPGGGSAGSGPTGTTSTPGGATTPAT